jgi:tRNA pseudouridine38-40 synthase
MEPTPSGDTEARAERRIALRVAYDGTDFLGWQRQASGRTVQGTLEAMLSRLAGDRPVTIVGAGRTDSGVHAAAQVAHADIDARMDDASLLHALRRMAPSDLAVLALTSVDRAFHARYGAHRRSYRYRILLAPDPFAVRYAWPCEWRLDGDLLRAAARGLGGRHDFTALSKNNPDTTDPLCEIVETTWSQDGSVLRFDVTADRFLYGMVRLLVGIQLDVARGRRPLADVADTIASRDRQRQSPAVPGHGLTLVAVGYPSDPFASITNPQVPSLFSAKPSNRQ